MTSVSQYATVALELDRLHSRIECLEGALKEIENLAPDLTWLASTDALHRAQEIARNALREGEKK